MMMSPYTDKPQFAGELGGIQVVDAESYNRLKKYSEELIAERDKVRQVQAKMLGRIDVLQDQHDDQQRTIIRQAGKITELTQEIERRKKMHDKDLEYLNGKIVPVYEALGVPSYNPARLALSAIGKLKQEIEAQANTVKELEQTHKEQEKGLPDSSVRLANQESTIKSLYERISFFENRERQIRQKFGMDEYGCIVNMAERVVIQRNKWEAEAVAQTQEIEVLRAAKANLDAINRNQYNELRAIREVFKEHGYKHLSLEDAANRVVAVLKQHKEALKEQAEKSDEQRGIVHNIADALSAAEIPWHWYKNIPGVVQDLIQDREALRRKVKAHSKEAADLSSAISEMERERDQLRSEFDAKVRFALYSQDSANGSYHTKQPSPIVSSYG